jgi:hypothetical protein
MLHCYVSVHRRISHATLVFIFFSLATYSSKAIDKLDISILLFYLLRIEVFLLFSPFRLRVQRVSGKVTMDPKSVVF